MIQFPEPPAQIVHGNVNKALGMPARVFEGRACIEQRHAAVRRKRGDVLKMELLDPARDEVIDEVARHVDGVLRRGIGRRIGEVEIFEQIRRQPRADGGREHVDALIHPRAADDLRTQQAERAALKEHLHRHDLRPGVVGRMICGREHDLVIVEPRGARRLLVDARRRRREGEHLDDGRTLRAAVFAVSAAEIVRRNAPLFVGGACERNERLCARDEVPHLHCVARRINVRVGRAHVRIGDDAPLLPQFEARLFGERRIGDNAQRDDRHVRLDRAAARENAHLLPRLQSFKGGAEPQVDAISDQLRVQEARHVRIERRKHLPAALDERDAHAALNKIFRRLQPDKSAAHDDRRLRLLPDDVVVHGKSIFHRAQGKDALIFRLRGGRQNGLCPGREQELIVTFLVRFARCKFTHRDRFTRAVDGDRLVSDARIHAVARIEGLRRLQC